MIAGMVILLPLQSNPDSVVGSLHDLSNIMSDPTMEWWDNFNQYDQVCIYCHTPHNANPTEGAPLWNRVDPSSVYTLYSSSRLKNQPGQPGPQSLVCLSCHDGTISVDAVINAPGNSSWDAWENPMWSGWNPFHGRMKNPGEPDFYAFRDCGGCHGANPIASNSYAGSFLSTDLSDDHPINITYPVGSPGYKALTNLETEGADLYDGKVECLSCHNVHDPEYKPFLIKQNGGSALCYICHAV